MATPTGSSAAPMVSMDSQLSTSTRMEKRFSENSCPHIKSEYKLTYKCKAEEYSGKRDIEDLAAFVEKHLAAPAAEEAKDAKDEL